jgi:hypothetical protein
MLTAKGTKVTKYGEKQKQNFVFFEPINFSIFLGELGALGGSNRFSVFLIFFEVVPVPLDGLFQA